MRDAGTIAVVQVAASVDGDDDVVAQLEAWLRSQPALAGVDVQRGRLQADPSGLGAAEVLTFLATEVSLPLILNAVYDFFRGRRRNRPAEQVRVMLTRTDLPGGARMIELRLEGPADAAVKAVQAAFGEQGAGG